MSNDSKEEKGIAGDLRQQVTRYYRKNIFGKRILFYTTVLIQRCDSNGEWQGLPIVNREIDT